jgi:hypothetical protein
MMESNYVRNFLGHCAWERRDWIVVIKAFFDESWNPNRPRMFAVGGILAPADEWDKIESGWRAVLIEKNAELAGQGRKPISRYHASEMNAKSNEFEGWSSVESLEFTQKLLSVIRGRKMFIISTAIILDDMVKVFPDWGQDSPGHAYGHAFLWCLHSCGAIAARPELFEPGQMIKAWHDQGDWNHFALDAFERTQKDPAYSEHWRFGALTHDSSVENVCLQVADMMAFECWRESERFVFENKQAQMRKFFSALVGVEEHRVYAAYADERYFTDLRGKLERKRAG